MVWFLQVSCRLNTKGGGGPLKQQQAEPAVEVNVVSSAPAERHSSALLLSGPDARIQSATVLRRPQFDQKLDHCALLEEVLPACLSSQCHICHTG